MEEPALVGLVGEDVSVLNGRVGPSKDSCVGKRAATVQVAHSFLFATPKVYVRWPQAGVGDSMTNVTKRSGELQAYDRRKLVESMVRAGASEPVAKEIAARVEVADGDGMSTIELRRRVAAELRKVNESVSEAYARTLRLPVKARNEVETGRALVAKRIERVPDMTSGQPGRLGFGERRAEVRIDPALEDREVWLNPSDFRALGAPEGTRISVRFLYQGGMPSLGSSAGRPRQTARLRA
jgi:hypothetical protein